MVEATESSTKLEAKLKGAQEDLESLKEQLRFVEGECCILRERDTMRADEGEALRVQLQQLKQEHETLKLQGVHNSGDGVELSDAGAMTIGESDTDGDKEKIQMRNDLEILNAYLGDLEEELKNKDQQIHELTQKIATTQG